MILQEGLLPHAGTFNGLALTKMFSPSGVSSATTTLKITKGDDSIPEASKLSAGTISARAKPLPPKKRRGGPLLSPGLESEVRASIDITPIDEMKSPNSSLPEDDKISSTQLSRRATEGYSAKTKVPPRR
jgi:hypothetical protein